MLIVETTSFTIGRFLIQQRPLTLNPAWPVFLIFSCGVCIGRQISRPSESDCRWFEVTGGKYADSSVDMGYTAASRRRQARLREQAA